MNIGIDIRCLTNKHRTGVGEYTFELLDALFNINSTDLEDCIDPNQYFLFYNSWKDVSNVIPKWNKKNIHYVITRFPNKLFNVLLGLIKRPFLDRLVSKKVGLKKIDVFFSPNVYFSSVSKDVKHILTIHDLSFKFFPECLSLKNRLWHTLGIFNLKKQISRADIVVTPSENTVRDVVREYGIAEEKMRVLNPGLSASFNDQRSTNNDHIRQKYNLPEKYVLFLGTIEPRKNILGIIKAFKNSSSASSADKFLVDGCSLVIAGTKGWKYKKILEEIDKTPGVQYIGYVDVEDKTALYKMASLFVYPSLYEGFGFPVLEAMMCGTPVITSNRSSLPEVVGDTAYLVNPYNVSEIEKGMKLILEVKKLRDNLVEKGRLQVKKFDYKKMAKEFLNLI